MALMTEYRIIFKDVPGVYQEWLPVPNEDGAYRCNFEAVVVTAWLPPKASRDYPEGIIDVIGSAWRSKASEPWVRAQGFFATKTLRPHPEADRVWAEYCAAVLVNEGAKR